MNEMIGYIFGSLHASEIEIKSIKKILRNQAKANNRFAFYILLTAICMTVAEIHNQEQNKKIEELSEEIKELKNVKGG